MLKTSELASNSWGAGSAPSERPRVSFRRGLRVGVGLAAHAPSVSSLIGLGACLGGLLGQVLRLGGRGHGGILRSRAAGFLNFIKNRSQ